MGQHRTISRISVLHYLKLFGRSTMLLIGFLFYLLYWRHDPKQIFAFPNRLSWALNLMWIIFAAEMALRFFPSPFESMGCQKQFKRNYRPTGKEINSLGTKKSTITVILSWTALNGAIGLLYFLDMIDEGILLLIALAYSVCDMICILFFCPFQTWMMKNKCCGSCRIYNWDFAMMFTPFLLIPTVYTWSLLGIALALLVYWEVMVHRYPERFTEKTNASLACANCQEKLCQHKKQLRRFLRTYNPLNK